MQALQGDVVDAGRVASGGWFEQSDLRRPGPRRRAVLWVVLCVAFVAVFSASAVSGGHWLEALLALFFAASGVRTARRLRNGPAA